METGNKARVQLLEEMTRENISPIARTRVDLITKACLGYNRAIETDLNLSYVNLEPQQPVIRKLAGICLDHFERQIAAQKAPEISETLPMASLVPGYQ